MSCYHNGMSVTSYTADITQALYSPFPSRMACSFVFIICGYDAPMQYQQVTHQHCIGTSFLTFGSVHVSTLYDRHDA